MEDLVHLIVNDYGGRGPDNQKWKMQLYFELQFDKVW